MLMELSPKLYHWFIRPGLFNKRYIQSLLAKDFDFQNKRVLDFGCGIGSNCFLFQSDKYLGLDKDSERIKYARRLNPDYNFRVIKGTKVKVVDNYFDFIVVIAVLHHIKAPGELIREFHRILKPGGKVLALEPCLFPDSPFHNHFMSLFDNGQYIRDRDGYLEIFNNNSFKIDKITRLPKLFYKELFFTATGLPIL
jgi:SAM-dependent methyltransferase